MSENQRRNKKFSVKEKKRIYQANKFYDDHMAGKWNKDAGYYNHDLTGKSKKSSLSGKPTPVRCNSCKALVVCKDGVFSFICSECGRYNNISG